VADAVLDLDVGAEGGQKEVEVPVSEVIPEALLANVTLDGAHVGEYTSKSRGEARRDRVRSGLIISDMPLLRRKMVAN